MNTKTPLTTMILWAVYVSLLAVLLPHTAWAFRQYEPTQSAIIFNDFTWADLVSYMVAFAFEASIAVLTHKLAKRIEETPRSKKLWRERFSYRYLNGIAVGLLIATLVSGMANLAHAVEFGRSLQIFALWGVPQGLYSVAFGGILPLVSLTFANVLSNVVESEEAPNPELTQANETIRALRSQVRESEQRLRSAEDRVKTAEDRFGTVTDLAKSMFGEDKRERILFARKQWKDLPNSAISIIAGASPAYVSEVLSASTNN